MESMSTDHFKHIGTFVLITGVLLFTAACSGSGNKSDAGSSEREGEAMEVAAGDTMQIEGSLICAHCYALNEENTGHDHELPESGFRENCAQFCSLQGYPIGILLDSEFAGSEVWVIRTSSQLFADYMTEIVRVEGTYVSEGVIDPLSIELKKGEADWLTIM